MKKALLIVMVAVGLALPLSVGSVFAQNIFEEGCEGVSGSTLCEETPQTPGNPIFGPGGILSDVLQLVTILVGVASVIMIIVGGFQYITSAGDPSKVNSAKNTILYAVIGIVVVLFAQALVLFVIRRI